MCFVNKLTARRQFRALRGDDRTASALVRPALPITIEGASGLVAWSRTARSSGSTAREIRRYEIPADLADAARPLARS
jgi:hypothetical protein